MFTAVYMDNTLGSLNVQSREEGSAVACTHNDVFYSWEGTTLGAHARWPLEEPKTSVSRATISSALIHCSDLLARFFHVDSHIGGTI